ncbi:fungal-specific transcription factor domain-containing protein [Limtongia smithiae]|uniref:fungal-specific transcription factor domain-containing protein n=1 Tax=Limtongia smithiae TaxID=1125753 RepID=UPI0034CD3506
METQDNGVDSDQAATPTDNHNGTSTAQSLKHKKRAKSRKGLAKMFSCDSPGCTKSFTRLEHLGRHQLNHAPKQIYRCEWPNCSKSFVREDLCVRHLERHQRRHSVRASANGNDGAYVESPSKRRGSNDMSVSSAESPKSDHRRSTTTQTASDVMHALPGATPIGYTPHEQHQASINNVPIIPPRRSTLVVDVKSPGEPVQMTDSYEPPTAVQGVSQDGAMQTYNPQSSTDLIDWLFSDAMLSGNRDFFAPTDFASFLDSPSFDFSQLSTPPQFSQTWLISETKRLELISLIPALGVNPNFTLDNIQRYIDLYWQKFHVQYPILHRKSFDIDTTPSPLVLCMIEIGAYYAHDQKMILEIVEPLRWIIFSSRDFHPPTKVWVLQSLLLLECCEKIMCTRKMHERAHIHHGATLQLIRRGSTLLDPSVTISPEDEDGSTWTRWVEAESIKRSVLMAFILDVTHSILFGHSLLMHAHEMRLSLPCDDSIWDSSEDERYLLLNSQPPLPFLVGLKRLLNQQSVEAEGFAMHTLLCGVMSLSIQMSQQALQVNSLGWGAFRDTWKSTIGRAYDFWYESHLDNKRKRLLKSGDGQGYGDPESASQSDTSSLFSLMYRMGQVCMHVARYDLHVFAGDPRVLGRSTLRQDIIASERHMYEWSKQESAKEAAFHAIKALYSVFMVGSDSDEWPSAIRDGEDMPLEPVGPPAIPTGYSVVDDPIIHRAAIIVHCTLVFWAYGFCRDGPESTVLSGRRRAIGFAHRKEHEWAMAAESGRTFLERMNRAKTPDELERIERKNLTVGLIKWVVLSLTGSKWEVGNEMIGILEDCVQKSLGEELDL